jgi:hypothetical protein
MAVEAAHVLEVHAHRREIARRRLAGVEVLVYAQPVVIKSLSDLGELTLWHFI